MVEVLNGPCKSVWINSRGLDERVVEDGNGWAFILPDKQGSQIGSGAWFEPSDKFLRNHLFDRVVIMVHETAMPQRDIEW